MKLHASTLGLVLLAFATFHPWVGRPSQAPGSGRGDSLLNGTVDEALARLGPPTWIRASDDEPSTWGWKDDSGASRQLTVYGERVVHLAPTTLGDGMPRRPLPTEGAYVGQSVERLIARRGQPDHVKSVHRNTTPVRITPPGQHGPVIRTRCVFVYGEEWLTIGKGRVVGIAGEPRQVIHGPR